MRGVLAAGSRYSVNPSRVRLMRSFDPTHVATADIPEVPDPYEGNDDGFERVFHMLHRACGGLLDRLAEPEGLDAIINR